MAEQVYTENIMNRSYNKHRSSSKNERTPEILNMVNTRKLGHFMGNQGRNGLLQRISQGKILEKCRPRHRRISWLENLRAWFFCFNKWTFMCHSR